MMLAERLFSRSRFRAKSANMRTFSRSPRKPCKYFSGRRKIPIFGKMYRIDAQPDDAALLRQIAVC
jgi:hypothetical protein